MLGKPVSQFLGAFQGLTEALSVSGLAQPGVITAITANNSNKVADFRISAVFMRPDARESPCHPP